MTRNLPPGLAGAIQREVFFREDGMAGVALVTGAGSGIGRASALALLADSWRVTLVGRRREALEETAARAGAAERALVVPCDVTDPAEVDAGFAATVGRFGRLDLLFNNAGTNVGTKTIDELTVDEWNTVISVNLHGAFLCARAAFARMRGQQPQGGRIINNGSISAHAPRPGSVPYTVSKHAITGLTRTLSLDGRPYNIACGQIDIGNAASEMTERMSSGVPQADGSMKPEPTMDVNHVAQAVVQMANYPLETNVQFLTIMATKMPFIGRG
jgi:NAD(P)-dependent dehydrogenase (short-subunit alcohol dehydrogenase family)